MGNYHEEVRDPRDVASVAEAIVLEAMQARVEHARRLARYATDRAVITETVHPEWFGWRGYAR